MRTLVSSLLATGLVLSGCAAQPGSSVDDGRTDVVAAFYPLAFAAERVGGDLVAVTNLTSPGSEPHDLELGVPESVAIAGADLIVTLHGFQPAVDEGVGQARSDGTAVVDAEEVVALLPVSEPSDDGHDDGLDPHFWLDPLLMADLADAVAAELGDIDPAHADDFADNATQLRSQLAVLDEEYAAGLSGCVRDTIVVSHDAFSYLERYGLNVVAINGLSPDAEPSPAGLADLQRLAVKDGITTVFYETLATPKLAQTLATDLGIDTAVLDPLEGLADGAGGDYLSVMRENLAALQKANEC